MEAPETHPADIVGPSIERVGGEWRVTMSQWLPVQPGELFPFFADAYNLERITPAVLRFAVVTPRPIDMHSGALIDYKLKVRGVPMRWRTRIESWDPPHGFVDVQLRGPYKLWHHTHTFTPERGGTRCGDVVRYRPPGGPLAPLINKVAVQRDVLAIFRYRARWLNEHFGGDAAIDAGAGSAA